MGIFCLQKKTLRITMNSWEIGNTGLKDFAKAISATKSLQELNVDFFEYFLLLIIFSLLLNKWSANWQ